MSTIDNWKKGFCPDGGMDVSVTRNEILDLQQIGRMLRLIAHAIVLRNVSAVLSAATPQNA